MKDNMKREQMFDTLTPESCRVALLAGGTSGEREISLASKDGALEALLAAGFQVEFLDPANREDLVRLLTESFDVAFLCLHGKGGEDGTIQGFLETIGLPYTGPGVLSNALCINKQKTKVFYERAAIPTPASAYLVRGQDYNADDLIASMGEKLVVKAATEGSSLGVYIVEGKEQLEQGIRDALTIDNAALVEQYIQGLELTCAVMGWGEQTTVLPIIEIIPRAASYDFDSKYAPGGCQHICPARISPEQTEQIQALAKKAHVALECHGISRTDFLLESNGDVWALETNTIPGMTKTSLVPDAAQAAGISFPEVCTQLIQSAFEKQAHKITGSCA